VECLRLGVGHASTVRPDPSTLGVVGERGSRHEGRSPARSRKPVTSLATPSGVPSLVVRRWGVLTVATAWR
jgi:hypothetical protein